MSSLTRSAHGLSTPCEDWWHRAACTKLDPDIWSTEATRPLAIHLCRSHCPVAEKCLRDAMANPPTQVVQGGVYWSQKQRIDGRELNPCGDICPVCFPGSDPTGCGTDQGYRRHRRRREVACWPCRVAAAKAKRDRRAVA